MKTIVLTIMVLFVSCASESSPEGRSRLRDKSISKEIDLLKSQNSAILDSIKLINSELDLIKAHENK